MVFLLSLRSENETAVKLSQKEKRPGSRKGFGTFQD
jgi:hypothetical protein